jgi:fermentation-respiration switch protein FrsA (DUF1100 family)
VLAIALVLVAGCLKVETFFFAGRPIDGYRWDEAAPELDGDLGDAHPSIVPAADREEGFATLEDGTAIHWVFAHRPGATVTILYSHGNGPHLGRAWDRVERLWALGFHVVVYDYPGYGRSGGDASEPGLYESAEVVWDAVLPGLRDVDPDRAIVYGQSLGAGPALHLAARADGRAGGAGASPPPRRPRAVITEAAFCSVQAMVEDGAFLHLDRELITDLEIDNCARMSELGPSIPVLLLHGTEDDVVPARQATRLAAAASGPVELRLVPGAEHANLPVVDPGYDAAITAFVATAID